MGFNNNFSYELEVEVKGPLDELSIEQIDSWIKIIVDEVKSKTPSKLSKNFFMKMDTKKMKIKVAFVTKLRNEVIATIKSHVDRIPENLKYIFAEIIRKYESQGDTMFVDFM